MGGVIPWNKYRALGSGSQYTTIIIKQQDRIHHLNNLDINVGIALHVIAEAKDIDLLTGKNTHIAIIDKTGYNEVFKEDQSKYYDKMIDNASSILSEQVDQEKFKGLLKNIFPSDYLY